MYYMIRRVGRQSPPPARRHPEPHRLQRSVPTSGATRLDTPNTRRALGDVGRGQGTIGVWALGIFGFFMAFLFLLVWDFWIL